AMICMSPPLRVSRTRMAAGTRGQASAAALRFLGPFHKAAAFVFRQVLGLVNDQGLQGQFQLSRTQAAAVRPAAEFHGALEILVDVRRDAVDELLEGVELGCHGVPRKARWLRLIRAVSTPYTRPAKRPPRCASLAMKSRSRAVITSSDSSMKKMRFQGSASPLAGSRSCHIQI